MHYSSEPRKFHDFVLFILKLCYFSNQAYTCYFVYQPDWQRPKQTLDRPKCLYTKQPITVDLVILACLNFR